MNKIMKALTPEGEFKTGEHLLLGGRPEGFGGAPIPPAHFYKKRYTWDGDPGFIGCTIGCIFCYYRWLDTTESTIGHGRKGLRHIGEPEVAAKQLEGVKLFRSGRDADIVMLCARSDGSVQVDECTRFLRAFKHPNLVFILHRGVFGQKQLDQWGPDERVVFSTTLTPCGPDLEWTPVTVEAQLKGLRFLLQNGVPATRISVMLGPLNDNNVEGGVKLMEELAGLGIKFLTFRGCSIGELKPESAKGLRQTGFLDGKQDEKSKPEGHAFYAMKNWLSAEVGAKIMAAGERLDVRLYRFTGALYEREFGVVVARNRNNRWRRELGQWVKVETPKLDQYLRWLGFHPKGITENEEGYLVELPDGECATEEIALTVGAEFRTSVLFNNHRIAPSLDDLRFYAANNLFPLPANWDSALR